jgi:hypothetical protein
VLFLVVKVRGISGVHEFAPTALSVFSIVESQEHGGNLSHLHLIVT